MLNWEEKNRIKKVVSSFIQNYLSTQFDWLLADITRFDWTLKIELKHMLNLKQMLNLKEKSSEWYVNQFDTFYSL